MGELVWKRACGLVEEVAEGEVGKVGREIVNRQGEVFTKLEEDKAGGKAVHGLVEVVTKNNMGDA